MTARKTDAVKYLYVRSFFIMSEVIAFVLYFVLVLGVGIYFFAKSKSSSEKDYFLGGR